MRVTQTGHVENEPGSRKLFELLRSDLRTKEKDGTAAELQTKLHELAVPTSGSAPATRILRETHETTTTVEHLQFESAPGIWLDATLYLPPSEGRKPAVVLVRGDDNMGGIPFQSLAQQMAKLGRIVLEVEPRASHVKNTEGALTGDWNTNLHANLIGLDLPALRAHDILRGVDLLYARNDVDTHSISGVAREVAGIWLLLAAASDPRLTSLWLDRTPYSLRSALDNSIAADLWDAVIPNFIFNWDSQDLVKLIGKRPVLWTDPTNWMHGVVALGPPYRYRYVPGDLTDETNVQDDRLIRLFLNNTSPAN